jgi:hypothetical protein
MLAGRVARYAEDRCPRGPTLGVRARPWGCGAHSITIWCQGQRSVDFSVVETDIRFFPQPLG